MAKIGIKQQDSKDCGAACLSSVGNHFGISIPIARIRQMAGTDRQGTNVLGLVEAADKMGLKAKCVRGSEDALPNIPLPAIAHIKIDKTEYHHYVVIYKMARKKIQLMDPLNGTLVKYNSSRFLEQWTGVLILFAKKKDFIRIDELQNPYKRFFTLIQPHKSILIQVLFGAVIYTLLGLGISVYVQKITDDVLLSSNRNLLNLMSLIMLGIIFLQAYIGSVRRIYVLKTGQLIDARLILGYYKHLMQLPQRFFDTMQVGEIISRVNDAVKIRALINNAAVDFLVNLFIIVFAFALMFTYHWRLAIIILLIVPFYLFFYTLVNRFNKSVERRLMEKSARLENHLVESISNVRAVKEFGIEEVAGIKAENRVIDLIFSYNRSGMNDIFAGTSTRFLASFFTVLLLWAGSGYVLEGQITTGELFSFYALMGYFTTPMTSLVGMNKTLQNALIAADRLFEIMDLERERSENRLVLQKEMLGDIRFENISFSYGTRTEVFKNFNAVVKKNKITAVVGESGSGKTTLIALLQQLYTLNEGRIKTAGIDLAMADRLSLRKLIAVIPQQLKLFSGNVIDNIALG
ncbi:MAG: peptidase domain-containing ABC transporter, partial [Flavobacteriaceae bacterium]